MTPLDLFKPGADLGLCTKKPYNARSGQVMWEWRKKDRLICGSVHHASLLGFASISVRGLTVPSDIETLRGLLRDDLTWQQVATRTLAAVFDAEVVG